MGQEEEAKVPVPMARALGASEIEVRRLMSDGQKQAAEEKDRLAGLNASWEAEKALVADIIELRAQLRAGAQPVEDTHTPEAIAAGGEDSPGPRAGCRGSPGPSASGDRLSGRLPGTSGSR